MIKKLVLKVAIKFGIIIGILMAVPYYFYAGGELPGFISDLGFGSSQNVKAKLPENYTNVVTDKEVTIYQWVDEHGIKHFGSAPPPNVAAEVRHLKPDQNVIQAVKVPDREEVVDEPAQEDEILKNPYNPETVKKLINDAKNVQKLLDQRFENQKELMGSGK